jgi:two-component system, NtrC family, sensor histidine kinase PilS
MKKTPNPQPESDIEAHPALNWRVLAVLNLYRILVPLVLMALYSIGGTRGIRIDSARLYLGAATFYLCFGLISVILVRRRLATATTQTILQATIDMVVLIMLLHASGGVANGLGLLFLLPVGGLAFLLQPRTAFFLAAIAALAVLADTIWQQVGGNADVTSYATAGLLGVVLFAFAAAASYSADRLRAS